MKYQNIINAIIDTPWALTEAKARALGEFIECRLLAGAEPLKIEAAAAPTYQRSGAVAIIPVYGILGQKMNLMSDYSGGTSTERIGAQIDAAVADETIRSVVLDIDSPGGSVFGVAELAAKLQAAREAKPIVAVANSTAASAAYWLGSQASEFVVTPSGEVGSIGVLAMHVDQSGANEAEGYKVSYISAGEHKTEGNPHEPLSDDARAYMQARVDAYYDDFITAVAKGRGVTAATVRDKFGKGRVMGAKDAKAIGMVDRIDTMENTIRRLTAGHNRARSMRARVALADVASR